MPSAHWKRQARSWSMRNSYTWQSYAAIPAWFQWLFLMRAKMNPSPIYFVLTHCYEARHLRLQWIFSRGTAGSEVRSAFRIRLHISFCLTARQMVCLPYPQRTSKPGENPSKWLSDVKQMCWNHIWVYFVILLYSV